MPGKPALTSEALFRAATLYLARYAASTERLRQVLGRRIARHVGDATSGEDLDEAAVASLTEPVIARLTALGLLDDAAFARGKAATLAAKGRPAWRIRADLAQAGVGFDEATLAQTLDDLDPQAQAMIWARRKRLGPFRSSDRQLYRERDIARLARAGFSVSVARAVVDSEPDA